MKNIAKKTIILYVLKMLYLGSSWDRPVTVTQMSNVLNSIGVECNRRTVLRNVHYLIDFGLPIIKTKGKDGGYVYVKEYDNFFKKGDNL